MGKVAYYPHIIGNNSIYICKYFRVLQKIIVFYTFLHKVGPRRPFGYKILSECFCLVKRPGRPMLF